MILIHKIKFNHLQQNKSNKKKLEKKYLSMFLTHTCVSHSERIIARLCIFININFTINSLQYTNCRNQFLGKISICIENCDIL